MCVRGRRCELPDLLTHFACLLAWFVDFHCYCNSNSLTDLCGRVCLYLIIGCKDGGNGAGGGDDDDATQEKNGTGTAVDLATANGAPLRNGGASNSTFYFSYFYYLTLQHN